MCGPTHHSFTQRQSPHKASNITNRFSMLAPLAQPHAAATASRRSRRCGGGGGGRRVVVVAVAASSEAASEAERTVERAAERAAEPWGYQAPDEVVERGAALREAVAARASSKAVLAPLTRGGHLPFRSLCCSYDAELVSVGEMAFARRLVKGNDRVERARMARAPDERLFGVQIATNAIAEGVAAARLAHEAGASFVDINCGCPQDLATKKGLGAVLLRKPTKLARLVAGVAAGSPLPVTVKIRAGPSDAKVNAARVVPLLLQAGAAFVAVHGRTQEQRYRRPADWQLLAGLCEAHPGRVVPNGDVLTPGELDDRLALAPGALAVMVGRAALIKPWVFEELRTGKDLQPGAAERVGVYRDLVSRMKRWFGDDAMGKKKAWYFFPWHFNFFCRYRPLPRDVYADEAKRHPLIATRRDAVSDPRVEPPPGALPPLERLLRCEGEAAHAAIADALWEAASDAEAVRALEALAAALLPEWEASDLLLRAGRGEGGGGGGGGGDDDEAGDPTAQG